MRSRRGWIQLDRLSRQAGCLANLTEASQQSAQSNAGFRRAGRTLEQLSICLAGHGTQTGLLSAGCQVEVKKRLCSRRLAMISRRELDSLHQMADCRAVVAGQLLV